MLLTLLSVLIDGLSHYAGGRCFMKRSLQKLARRTSGIYFVVINMFRKINDRYWYNSDFLQKFYFLKNHFRSNVFDTLEILTGF